MIATNEIQKIIMRNLRIHITYVIYIICNIIYSAKWGNLRGMIVLDVYDIKTNPRLNN